MNFQQWHAQKSKSYDNIEIKPILMQTSDAQSDPNIAHYAADEESDTEASGDSDFAMHIGSNCDVFITHLSEKT